ncbi:beta-propeller fold lactonase family protein [Streptomyces sp. NPDC002790]|uniref:lactonase family protein n=1 Tax=Streptomyces sp. NPDC002790 TaxID=3154431 RepID=UPI00332920BD
MAKGTVALGFSLFAGTVPARAVAGTRTSTMFLAVGAWSHLGGEQGLWLYEFDPRTGDLKLKTAVADDISVGDFFVTPKNDALYVVDSKADLPGETGGGGRVISFAIDADSGELTQICAARTYAAMPSMPAVDGTGRYLMVSNHGTSAPVTKSEKGRDGTWHVTTDYGDSTTALFPVDENRVIGQPYDMYKHHGSGPNANQANAHPHCCVPDPSGNLFAVCDKGSDRISFFRIDRDRNELIRTSEHARPSGSAPRYCTFHPHKPYFFMNNEAVNEVCAFTYDTEGNLTPVNTVEPVPGRWLKSRIPEGGKFEQQDLKLNASGTRLYAITRGASDNTSGFECITTFMVDQESGRLTRLQILNLDCTWPRGCDISPDGQYLVVACISSEELLVLKIRENGTLQDTGKRTPQPTAAACIFYELPHHSH